jgi:hypothetical protein
VITGQLNPNLDFTVASTDINSVVINFPSFPSTSPTVSVNGFLTADLFFYSKVNSFLNAINLNQIPYQNLLKLVNIQHSNPTERVSTYLNVQSQLLEINLQTQ